MSNITLSSNASGTATFNIASPPTNTNRTLTLPDAAGTVMLTDTSATQAQLATALNASGNAPLYACRAWVNFNGTGTVAIRASGNVSSITDFGTGDFGLNFTTAMSDVNYAVLALFKSTTTLPTPTAEFDQHINAYASTVSQATIYTGWRNENSSGRMDPVQVHAAIFR